MDLFFPDLLAQIRYASFLRRALASIIDSIIWAIISLPILLILNEQGIVLKDIGSLTFDLFLPFILTLFFWQMYQATPGKLLLNIKIVCIETGAKPNFKQLVLRYLAYFVSIITLGLGFLWVIWDKKNQGLHDKLAKTAVVNNQWLVL